MKKTYQKPELFFEDYTIMDAITSGNCGTPVGHSEASCRLGVTSPYHPDPSLDMSIFFDACEIESGGNEYGPYVFFSS